MLTVRRRVNKDIFIIAEEREEDDDWDLSLEAYGKTYNYGRVWVGFGDDFRHDSFWKGAAKSFQKMFEQQVKFPLHEIEMKARELTSELRNLVLVHDVMEE